MIALQFPFLHPYFAKGYVILVYKRQLASPVEVSIIERQEKDYKISRIAMVLLATLHDIFYVLHNMIDFFISLFNVT